MSARCWRCGKEVADGFASINGRRYCHPDEGQSCFVIEQNVMERQKRNREVLTFGDSWADFL